MFDDLQSPFEACRVGCQVSRPWFSSLSPRELCVMVGQGIGHDQYLREQGATDETDEHLYRVCMYQLNMYFESLGYQWEFHYSKYIEEGRAKGYRLGVENCYY